MLCRDAAGALEFSLDGKAIAFKLERGRFAHVAHLCADGDAVVVTAAESPPDAADVQTGRRGRYRAWRVGAQGARRLTDEATYGAIALPGGADALAYGNGTHLVLLVGGQRRAFKVGSFSWGPPSLCTDAAGRRVAMTRWRGDDRKLFWLHVASGQSALSAASHFGFLLRDDDACLLAGAGLKRLRFDDGSLKTITDARFCRTVAQALGLPAADAGRLDFRWTAPAWHDGQIATAVLVREPPSYAWLAHAVLLFDDRGDAPPRVLGEAIEPPWGVTALAGDGRTLQARLERYEDGWLVATRTQGLGAQAAAIDAGWQLVAPAQQPDLGFAFLPGVAT